MGGMKQSVGLWAADAYIYGHVHEKKIDFIPRLGLNGEKLINKPKILMIAGIFLKTFMDVTVPTCGEKFGYPTTPIGGVAINIVPDIDWCDITAS